MKTAEQSGAAAPPADPGWVHVGSYPDEAGLRRCLDRLRRAWGDRYETRVVAAAGGGRGATVWSLYVRHR